MPPKKAKATATPRKATSVPLPMPASVTTKRGKEYETTAAAGRPRRTTMMPTVQDSSAAKKTKSKAATALPTKKRGRATQAADATEDGAPPKKRGRPAKAKAEEPAEPVAEPPRKRGRPAKADAEEPAESIAEPPKKRGRPAEAKAADSTAATPKRGPGRPKKQAAVPEEEEGPPFTRHEAPFGSETTVVKRDEGVAAEQLEEELLETADESAETTTRKRTAPVARKGTANGKGAKKAVLDDNDDDEAVDAADASAEWSGKSFWLMKAEQEDRFEPSEGGRINNTKFTISDLQAKTVPEPWDGVRNAVAAKNMRAMRRGDLAFFYASGGKSGRKPGITGIMEVVAEATPDETVHDENAYGYVKKEADRGKWVVVHVEHRKTLAEPVYLAELQKYKTGVLENMQLLRQGRLSVSKVSEKEWTFIIEKLVEGYEDENKTEAVGDSSLPTSSGATNGDLDVVLPSVESGHHSTDKLQPATASRAASRASSRRASEEPSDVRGTGVTRGLAGMLAAVRSLGPSINSPDETMEASKARGSRAASRTSSRQASRAPSAGRTANATAESVPPRAVRSGSRGRSRTPKIKDGTVMGTVPEKGNLAAVTEE